MPAEYIGDLTTTATAPAADDYEVLDGATNGTRKILASRRESMLAARPPSSGLHITATGAQRTTHAVRALGTGNFSFDLSIPVMGAVGPAAAIWYSAASGNNRVQVRLSTGRVLSLRFTDGSGTETDYTLGTYALTVGGSHDLSLAADRAGNAVLYDFGAEVASVDISAAATIELAASATAGLYGAFLGVVDRPRLWNVALDDTEESTVFARGPAGLPLYVYAAGARLRYITDFSSSTNWSLAGGSTISSGKLNIPDAGSAYTSFGTGLTDFLKGAIATFTVTVDSITAGNLTYFNGSGYIPFAAAPGTYTITFTAVGIVAALIFKSVGGDVVADDFSFTSRGLSGSWVFDGTGAGYQERDLSGAGNPMLLTTTGVSRLAPSNTVRVVHDFAFSGTTPLQATGQSVLPDLNWRLDWITAESDTSVNTNFGNVSAGSQIVAAEALTANTPKELTIVSSARIPTTLNLWGQSSATANVRITAQYTRISTQS